MRGCVTLLMFMGMLMLPFVVFGYSAVAFIVMAVVFGVLWGLTKVAEAAARALAQAEEKEKDDQLRELSE